MIIAEEEQQEDFQARRPKKKKKGFGSVSSLQLTALASVYYNTENKTSAGSADGLKDDFLNDWKQIKNLSLEIRIRSSELKHSATRATSRARTGAPVIAMATYFVK